MTDPDETIGQAAADARDGEAMRRLRQAFPGLEFRLTRLIRGDYVLEAKDEYGRYIGMPVVAATIVEVVDEWRRRGRETPD